MHAFLCVMKSSRPNGPSSPAITIYYLEVSLQPGPQFLLSIHMKHCKHCLPSSHYTLANLSTPVVPRKPSSHCMPSGCLLAATQILGWQAPGTEQQGLCAWAWFWYGYANKSRGFLVNGNHAIQTDVPQSREPYTQVEQVRRYRINKFSSFLRKLCVHDIRPGFVKKPAEKINFACRLSLSSILRSSLILDLTPLVLGPC